MSLLIDYLMDTYSFSNKEDIEKAVHYVKMYKGLSLVPKTDRSILLKVDMLKVMDKAFKDGITPLEAAQLKYSKE